MGMRGYTGTARLFHAETDCHLLHGEVRELPETKALKWDLTVCPECFEDAPW